MGLFFDLYQQSQISHQRERAVSTEARLDHLEREMQQLQQLLHDVITRLEQHVGTDLDRDGRVG